MLDATALVSFDRELHPAYPAYSQGLLTVNGGHQLHWSLGGNPNGVPVLFLHGGPGGGTHQVYRRYFDPQHYKVILLDQRGAGKSLPYASIDHNTTHDLLNDIEALRQHLQIDRWILFGGSWGSTLALLAAQRWPQHCIALCLRGLFMGTAAEIDWFFAGVRTFYPEASRDFSQHVGETDPQAMLSTTD